MFRKFKARSELKEQLIGTNIDLKWQHIQKTIIQIILFTQHLETLIDCLYFGNDDPTRDLFEKYYMPLAEMKDFNALIDNKPFFDQPVKKQKRGV